MDYAQHCGFVTDTARVRHPKDKPRVERTVQYVRSNCWAGEQFVDLADAQARTRTWCADVAGQRIHGTIQARPAQVFAEHEAGALLAVPAGYDVPVFKTCKVHRDYHLEVGKALYSVPKVYIGQLVDVRANSVLVKVFHNGQLVKVHPRQRPGGRFTDPTTCPLRRSATRCVTWTGWWQRPGPITVASDSTVRDYVRRARLRVAHPHADQLVSNRAVLFAAIRQESGNHDLVANLSDMFAVDRDIVLQALTGKIALPRPTPKRTPILEELRPHIDAMIASDPRTAITRIWERLVDEHHADVSYSTVRDYVTRQRATERLH